MLGFSFCKNKEVAERGKHDGEVWRTIHGHRVQIDSQSVQKQLSMIFGNKKARNSKTVNISNDKYKRLENQAFNYPKKFKNGNSYFVDLDSDLYEISIENHTPIVHNVIKDYEAILEALDIKLKGSKK